MSIPKEMGQVLAIFLVILFIVFVIAMPWVLIWSVNTLFSLGIPYTFKTYLAALVLGGLFSARATSSSSK